MVSRDQGGFFCLFSAFDGGAVSSASTLAEGSPELAGAVLVEVDVLGTFLFRPSRDVSVSLTERLRTYQRYSVSMGTKETTTTAKLESSFF